MPSSVSSIKWPIIGTWKVEGRQERHPGILIVEDDKVYLKIFLEISKPNQQAFGNAMEDHPSLVPFQPPHQPTVLGETKAVGKVTLLNCMLSNTEGTHQID